MVSWFCPTSTSMDHHDGYLRCEDQPCRCSNTTPLWSSLFVPAAGPAGLVLSGSEHWLCPGLETGCAHAAPVWPGLK